MIANTYNTSGIPVDYHSRKVKEMTKREITNKYRKRRDMSRLMLEIRQNGLQYHRESQDNYESYIKECKENGYDKKWAINNWLNNIAK